MYAYCIIDTSLSNLLTHLVLLRLLEFAIFYYSSEIQVILSAWLVLYLVCLYISWGPSMLGSGEMLLVLSRSSSHQKKRQEFFSSFQFVILIIQSFLEVGEATFLSDFFYFSKIIKFYVTQELYKFFILPKLISQFLLVNIYCTVCTTGGT